MGSRQRGPRFRELNVQSFSRPVALGYSNLVESGRVATAIRFFFGRFSASP
jgi:hypothetical protein